VLVTGAFDDDHYRFGFFERIAETLEREGPQVARFNAFGFNRSLGFAAKLAERVFTLPGRWVGIDKQRIRAALPWTPDGRRERALLDAVRAFLPDTLIVIRGFALQPVTLRRCRRLGARYLIGWYVEGPLEGGRPEAESLSYDRYFCIHDDLAPAYREWIAWLPSYARDARDFSRLRWPRTTVARIIFVGTPTERRVRFLEALRSLPLELWGPKWSAI
jgi:hypothetical protein